MIIEQPVSGIPDTGCLNVLLITVRPDPDMNRDNTLMITGDIRKKILLFALPIFLGNLFQQLYNAADSIIVGNFISSSALAAVSSAGNLIFLVIGFFNGISVGAGVVIAHYIGARNAKSTEEAVHTTVALGIVSSIILTAVGTLLAPVMLRLMNTPPEVLPQSITYFRIYFAGSFGFVMYNTFVGILQASGDSRHPLIYLAIASAVNVVLDLLLIAGLHMGVGAAAFATAVSQLLSAFLAMTKLLRTDADYRLVLTKIRFRKHLLKKVLQYGLPTGLSNSVMALSNVVIQSYINAYGAKAVAGIGAYIKIEGFAFIPITGFAMAMTTFIGQNLGAGEYGRAKKGTYFGITCALAASEVIGLVLFRFAPQLIAFFDSDPEVIAFGTMRARYVTLFFFLCAFTHVGSAVLRGYGRPVASMCVFLLCWCVVRVVILAVAERFAHTIRTTFIVYPVTWTLSSTVILILLILTFRKHPLAQS